MQSGLDEPWWSDSIQCCRYVRNTQDVFSAGTAPYERRCGEPFSGPIILFGAGVEYHSISTKDQGKLHPFGKHVLSGILWATPSLRREAAFQEIDASKVHVKRCKMLSYRKKKNTSYFHGQKERLRWQEQGLKSKHPTNSTR